MAVFFVLVREEIWMMVLMVEVKRLWWMLVALMLKMEVVAADGRTSPGLYLVRNAGAWPVRDASLRFQVAAMEAVLVVMEVTAW